jgi:pilus assembly protein Flp/PilA
MLVAAGARGGGLTPRRGLDDIKEVNLSMLNFFVPYLSGLLARVREEDGQGLAEYALILAFIAVVAIAALTFLGSDISSLLSKVATSL